MRSIREEHDTVFRWIGKDLDEYRGEKVDDRPDGYCNGTTVWLKHRGKGTVGPDNPIYRSKQIGPEFRGYRCLDETKGRRGR